MSLIKLCQSKDVDLGKIRGILMKGEWSHNAVHLIFFAMKHIHCSTMIYLNNIQIERH